MRPDKFENPLLVAAAVLRKEGRVLLTRRPAGTQFAGCWEFPGGKVETGENVRAAIVREMWEELEVATRPIALHSCGFVETGRTIILSAVEVDLVRGTPRPTDRREMTWIEPVSIDPASLPPADLPILEALLADSSGRPIPLRRWADVVHDRPWTCRTGPNTIEELHPEKLRENWRVEVVSGLRLIERMVSD